MAAMHFLILLFTAFRINDPVVSLAEISGGSLSTNCTVNATIFADVKVRNPNAAALSFRAGAAVAGSEQRRPVGSEQRWR
ncbi:hypothetical protein LINPERPRIM_LOCUS23395 [Linum perenne]